MDEFSKLDINYLMPGDILVATTTNITPDIIRLGIHSVINHAMLYIGEGNVVEADEDGAEICSLQSDIESYGYRQVMAFRYPTLSPDTAKQIIEIAVRETESDFDFSLLSGSRENADFMNSLANPDISSIMFPDDTESDVFVRHTNQEMDFDNPDRFYCTELIFETFLKAGIALGSELPHLTNPQQIVDLSNNGTLSYLGELT
jgi:hypothetical protein